jgi:hypothetical protein
MAGPRTRSGRVSSVSVFDVAPTVLYLLDLPVGEDMDGTPAREALRLSRKLRAQRYGDQLLTDKEGKRDKDVDESALEELRAIGYIE